MMRTHCRVIQTKRELVPKATCDPPNLRLFMETFRCVTVLFHRTNLSRICLVRDGFRSNTTWAVCRPSKVILTCAQHA
jgi:hypothetical protein